MPDPDMLFIRLAEFFAERREAPAEPEASQMATPPPRPQPPATEEH